MFWAFVNSTAEVVCVCHILNSGKVVVGPVYSLRDDTGERQSPDDILAHYGYRVTSPWVPLLSGIYAVLSG